MTTTTNLRTLVLFLAALLVSPSALAQSAAAQELYEQGKAALAAGDLATACARFAASDKIEPGVGVRASLGACLERQGKLASAWEAFKGALAKAAPTDDRIPKIQERISALQPRLPRLVLKLAAGAPPDTTVTESTATIGATGTWGISLPFDPGPHRLTVSSAGRAPRTVDVVLVEGKTTPVTIGPETDVAGPAEDLANPYQPGPVAPPAQPLEGGVGPGPWIVGGVGVAGAITAIAAGVITLNKKSAADAGCNPATRTCTQAGKDAADAGRVTGAVTTAGLVVAGAGLAGAGIWAGIKGSKKPVRVGLQGTVVTIGGAW